MIELGMSLGQMIARLKHVTSNVYVEAPVTLIPVSLDSYRGYYEDLAIGVDVSEDGLKCPAEDFRTSLQVAIGKTYEGYKGGQFVMSKDTRMWVSNRGETSGHIVTDILVTEYGTWILTEHVGGR